MRNVSRINYYLRPATFGIIKYFLLLFHKLQVAKGAAISIANNNYCSRYTS